MRLKVGFQEILDNNGRTVLGNGLEDTCRSSMPQSRNAVLLIDVSQCGSYGRNTRVGILNGNGSSNQWHVDALDQGRDSQGRQYRGHGFIQASFLQNTFAMIASPENSRSSPSHSQD